jgi:hypothetical protein
MDLSKIDQGNFNVVDINLNNYNSIYTTINSISKGDSEKPEITFNITYTCSNYINTDCYLLIVCVVNELRSLGKIVHVNFDTQQECDTIRYASRINFFSNLGIEYKETFERHDTSGSLLEITNISQDSYGLDENIITLLQNNFDLCEEDCECLITIFYELICNITLHSNSKNGGYLYCQKFKKKNSLELIMADFGIGIRKSLRTAYPDYTNETALLECIKFEVTSGNGRGHGLFIISELLKRNKGEFRLISKNNSIVVVEESVELLNHASWDGTIVKCTFNLNNPLPLKEIINEKKYLK